MIIIQTLIGACITIFSLGLLLISLSGYKRHKNPKLIFVSLVFILFLIKGLLLTLNVFFDDFIPLNFDPILGIVDIIMLLFLYMATFKRRIHE
jgi:hypothetical protein